MSGQSLQLATTIEAILYLKGQPLTIAEIAACASCNRQEAQTAILELMEVYAHRDTALEVEQLSKIMQTNSLNSV
jgi:segregation and condensation protein B